MGAPSRQKQSQKEPQQHGARQSPALLPGRSVNRFGFSVGFVGISLRRESCHRVQGGDELPLREDAGCVGGLLGGFLMFSW